MAVGFFPPSDITAVAVCPTPANAGTPGYFALANGTIPATIVSQDILNGLICEFSSLATAGGTPLTLATPTMVTNIKGLINLNSSLYVQIAGSTMTGNLITGHNYSGTQTTPALTIQNGSYNLAVYPRVAAAAYNPIVQANDSLLMFSNGTINTGALVIGPWASGTSGGLRIDSAGNVTVSENLNTQTALFLQNGTSNRWSLMYSGSESGSNAGSNFYLQSFTDAGAWLANPISVVRSTGVVMFAVSPTAPTPATADNSTLVATTAFVKNQGYAPLVSPTFTGAVTVPAPGSIGNIAATTNWVNTNYAPLASPTLTGVPTCPTGPWTWDSRLANQAWVGAYFAPLVSPGFTGAPTTQAPAAYDNSSHIPSTSWIWSNLTNFATNSGGNYTSNGNGSCITFPGWVTNSTPIKLQFGQNSFYGSSGSYQYQYFPVTFPNSVIAVFTTIGWNSGGSVIGGQNANNSCMTIGWELAGSTAYAAGESYSWFAVGY